MQTDLDWVDGQVAQTERECEIMVERVRERYRVRLAVLQELRAIVAEGGIGTARASEPSEGPPTDPAPPAHSSPGASASPARPNTRAAGREARALIREAMVPGEWVAQDVVCERTGLNHNTVRTQLRNMVGKDELGAMGVTRARRYRLRTPSPGDPAGNGSLPGRIHALLVHRALTPAQAAAELDAAVLEVARHMDALVNEGEAERDADGVYVAKP